MGFCCSVCTPPPPPTPTPSWTSLGSPEVHLLSASIIDQSHVTVCCALQVSCSELGRTDPVELSTSECSCRVERMFGYLFRSARMVVFFCLPWGSWTSSAVRARQSACAKDLRCVSAWLFSSLWHWGLEVLSCAVSVQSVDCGLDWTKMNKQPWVILVTDLQTPGVLNFNCHIYIYYIHTWLQTVDTICDT